MALSRSIDPSSATPLYHQIYLLFRQKILSGELRTGETLPTEEQICEDFSVSRITSKRALNELAADGLVKRTRGRGTTVAQDVPQASMGADFGGLLENLAAIGSSTTVGVISLDYVPAPAPIAAALQVPEGSELQRVERYREKENTRFSHILTHVPADIGRSYSREELSQHPILELIEATGHRVASAEQTITSVLADPGLAGHLETSIGAPLLQITRLVFDQAERPVQHIVVHYRPELYALRMRLSRDVDYDSGRNIWAAGRL